MVFLPTISSSKINPIATTRFAFLKQNSHLHTALIKKKTKKKNNHSVVLVWHSVSPTWPILLTSHLTTALNVALCTVLSLGIATCYELNCVPPKFIQSGLSCAAVTQKHATGALQRWKLQCLMNSITIYHMPLNGWSLKTLSLTISVCPVSKKKRKHILMSYLNKTPMKV